MLKKIIPSVFFILLIMFSNSNAATLRIEIEKLELFPEGVWAYQLGFTVNGDWNFVASANGLDTESIDWNYGVNGFNGYGGIISPYAKTTPPSGPFPEQYTNTWDLNAKLPGNTLNIVAMDNEGGMNILKNGWLLTLIYPENVIIELTTSIFLSASDLTTELPISASSLTFGPGNNTLVFTPVPSSLFLLGGGLFALVGITRRKK
ncbi:MAG: PEP-CTERM sorting domain-containing protein [Desulfobacula sp.]|jgi:hypothetical protein